MLTKVFWFQTLLFLVFFCATLVSCPNSGRDDGGGAQEDPNNPRVDGIVIGDTVTGKGVLVWRDEFNGDALDLSKWNYDLGGGGQYSPDHWGWGNNERQWYMEKNVRVENGSLVIEARHDYPDVSFPYSSGKITTAGTLKPAKGTSQAEISPPKDFLGVTTGYVEARFKTPRGAGFWPAFWMLGANVNEYSGYPSVGWPRSGEIDIFEMKGGQETTLEQTIHFGEAWGSAHWYISKGTTVPNMADDFHTYAVSWDSTGLTFYFDGGLTRRINWGELTARGGDRAHPEAFYDGVPWVLIFNLAVGGNFLGGTLPAESAFQGGTEAHSLMVDWVRVYQ